MDAEAVTTNVDTELKRKLLEYLDTIEGAVKAGAELVSEKSPVVIQEILRFTFWQMIAGVAFGLLVIWCARFLWRKASRCNDSADKGTVYALSVIAFSVGAVIAAASAETLLKVTLAPNVYIIETIADLIK